MSFDPNSSSCIRSQNNISGTGNPLLDSTYTITCKKLLGEHPKITVGVRVILFLPKASGESNLRAGIHLSDLSNWLWKWHIPNSQGFAKWFPLKCESLAVHPLFWTQIPVATLTPRLAQSWSAALESGGMTTPACSLRIHSPQFLKAACNHPTIGGLKGNFYYCY